jgi:hypothetical protein
VRIHSDTIWGSVRGALLQAAMATRATAGARGKRASFMGAFA